MDAVWFAILSLSIIPVALFGGIRFSKITPSWYPFIFCCWVGAANELISFLLTSLHYSTNINNNIYVLMEAVLIFWQFCNWQVFPSGKKIFYPLLAVTIVWWLVENISYQRIFSVSYYFRIFYSFLIVIISIQYSSTIIITYRRPLLKNAAYLVCAGFIIFYTYKILVEISWLYGFNATPAFRINVYTILAFINCLINLLYLTAIIWVPSKQHSSSSSY